MRPLSSAVSWPRDGTSADAYADQGAALFITEIHPTDEGHDLSPLKELLSWRGQRNTL